MRLDQVSAGKRAPHEINVIIEIPAHSAPVKYELDKATGAMFVDRFLSTAMFYPCNYGYVPETLSEDGDPVDVLILTPMPLFTGAVMTCRPLGVLEMTDEKGPDAKLLAVPLDSQTGLYRHVKSLADIEQERLDAIKHFFEHYKDLEPNKWVKVDGWADEKAAQAEITNSMKRYQTEK